MSERLNCALVGYGTIAPFYEEALREHPRFRLVAVAETDRDKGAAIQKAGYHWYPNPTELLTEPSIDAVCVLTPNCFHAVQTIDALKAGKHVLCEKPMATNVADAKRMVEVARATGKTLFVPFHHSYHDAALRVMREIADQASQGNEAIRFTAVNIEQTVEFADPDNLWYFQRKVSGGGSIIDMGINFLALLDDCVGPLTVVDTRIEQTIGDVEAEAHITFTFHDGRGTGTLFVSSVAAAERRLITFRLDNGDQLKLDLLAEHPTYADGVMMRQEYARVIAAFAEAIARGDEVGEQGLKLQQLVEGIYHRVQQP